MSTGAKLFKNCLLEWSNGGSRWLERVLYVDIKTGSAVFLRLDLKEPKKKSWPFWRHADQIKAADKCIKLLTVDPYLRQPVDQSNLSVAQRLRYEKNWAAIQPIVDNSTLNIFGTRKERAGIVARAEKESGIHRTTIYDLLWRFWKGGQSPQCVLPDYRPGMKREFRGGKKRGRKSAVEKETGQQVGIVVTADVKEMIREGIRMFFTESSSNSLHDAYVLTLADKWNVGYQLQDGILVPIVAPLDAIPTFRQFSNIYYAERNAKEEAIGRQRENSFNLKGRATLGKSETSVLGPGEGQIDWTTADIYLLSDHDPNLIVGRPLLYSMKDVWAKCFYSVIITFYRASYWSAAIALENALMSKVEYCSQYGIEINEEEWPVQFLPASLRVDGGELSTYKSDQLIRGLGMSISTLPPYRGDLKGLIERQHGLFNGHLIHCLPGALPRERQSNEKPSPLDAVLTVSQFRRLVLEEVRRYHRAVLTGYSPDLDVIKAGIPITPISLLKWGLEFRGGAVLKPPMEQARLRLLPGGEATVSQDGVEFQKLYYTCDRAVIEGWYERAARWGNHRITVCFDPRDASRIYLRGPKTTRLEPLVLMERSLGFSGWPWATVEEYFKQKAVTEKLQGYQELQDSVRVNAAIQQISTAAIKSKKERGRKGQQLSRAAQLRNVPPNQAQVRRQDDAASRQSSETSSPQGVASEDKLVPFPAAPAPIAAESIPAEQPIPAVASPLHNALRSKIPKVNQV